MRELLFVGILFLAITLPLRAQESYTSDQIRPGARVRVDISSIVARTPRNLPTIQLDGTVRAIGPDTLYLGLATPPRDSAVPRMFIQRIQQSLGPPSRRESAKEVALMGWVLGLMIPPVLPKRTAAFVRGRDEGMIVGMSVGFVAGALVGWIFPYERWRPAFIPE